MTPATVPAGVRAEVDEAMCTMTNHRWAWASGSADGYVVPSDIRCQCGAYTYGEALRLIRNAGAPMSEPR